MQGEEEGGSVIMVPPLVVCKSCNGRRKDDEYATAADSDNS